MKYYYIIIFIFIMACKNAHRQIGVVDISSLYKKYDGRVAIEKKYFDLLKNIKDKRDSLNFLLNSNNSTIGFESLATIREEIIKKEAKMNEIQMELQQQVWNQLNEYVNSYGEESSFEIIIGARNDGHLLYSKESIDITEDILKYVNEKYKGK